VYIGSINLDYTSLHQNRELGIIIVNPVIAEEVRDVILQWYSEYTGQAPKPTSNYTSAPTAVSPPTSATSSTSASTMLVVFFIIVIILYAVARLRRRRYW
jgi:hypothetical protein